MNNVNTQKPYREVLKDRLVALGENPEVVASEVFRAKIASALDDINEVGGKENARMVIWEIEDALENTGVRSIRPSDAPENAVA